VRKGDFKGYHRPDKREEPPVLPHRSGHALDEASPRTRRLRRRQMGALRGVGVCLMLPHVPAAARQPRRACASPQVRPQPTRSRAAAARQGLAGRRRRADAGRAPIGRARIRTALRVRCRGAPTTLRSHQLAAGLSSCARHCSGVASGQPAARCSGAERLCWRGCWWGCGSSAARSGVRRAAGRWILRAVLWPF